MLHEKCCPGCKLIKPADQFYSRPKSCNGLSSRCKSCEKARDIDNYYHGKKGEGRQHREPIAIRFWRQVDMSGGPDACWRWQGRQNESGYGLLKHVHLQNFTTHRIAWELTHGVIPEGMSVLHRCDVRHCVNPAHLWLGTQADNMQDCATKGRMQGSRKVDNPPQLRAPRIHHRKGLHTIPWEERFWAMVAKTDNLRECWLWTGSLSGGYGRFRLKNSVSLAHVLSYRLAYGEYLPSLQVRHSCDQTACVNPRHLLLGTKDDNLRDMIARNRHAHTLTSVQASYARSQQGIQTSKALATELGVTRAAISAIWNRRTWKHLL